MKAHKQMTRDEALFIVNAISNPPAPAPAPATVTDNAVEPSKLTLTDSLDLVEKRIAILNEWLTTLENSAVKLSARI